MAKPVACICEHCACKAECEFYAETIHPCQTVVEINHFSETDPFIRCLMVNLNDFECDAFELDAKEENNVN